MFWARRVVVQQKHYATTAERRSASAMSSSVHRADLLSVRPVSRSIRLSMSNLHRLSTQRTRNERGLDRWFVVRAVADYICFGIAITTLSRLTLTRRNLWSCKFLLPVSLRDHVLSPGVEGLADLPSVTLHWYHHPVRAG